MKNWIMLMIGVCFTLGSVAQNDRGAMDDLERIALKPIVLKSEGMSENSVKMLEGRLMQLATATGLAAKGESSQFALVGRVSLVDKNVTMTAPPMQTVTLQFDLYVIDLYSEAVFNNYTQELKGVGENDTKAYNSAIKNITPKNSGIKAMIQKGKMKIVEYYNAQCEQILEQARVLATGGMTREALTVYYNVPDVCAECKSRANDAMGEILSEHNNQLCEERSALVLGLIKSGAESGEIMKRYEEMVQTPGCSAKSEEVIQALKEKNLADQAAKAEEMAKAEAASQDAEPTPESTMAETKKVISEMKDADAEDAAMRAEEKAQEIIGGN
ncbi:hypothetical protein KFE98_03950 [bacterium SCSIO 12741]|nr:hypothetical protein KFE98_03950 [bacterium SCSIO 12741]